MQKNVTKQSVFMGSRPHNKGFTLITTLLMISVLAMTLPFLSYLLNAAKTESDYEELSVQEFYRYIRDQLIRSSSLTITDDKLYLIQNEKDVVIGKFGEHLMRRVKDEGYEVYLRDIEKVQFEESPYGLKIIITSLQGEIYEKSFIFYN